jgi:hypothetical protein
MMVPVRDRPDDPRSHDRLLDAENLGVDQLAPGVDELADRLALDREDDDVVALERLDRRVVGRPRRWKALVERRA